MLATTTRHTEAVGAAALAHDRLTDLLIGGGGVAEVAEVLSGVLSRRRGRSAMPTGELLAGDVDPQASAGRGARGGGRGR